MTKTARSADCPFCDRSAFKILAENDLTFVIPDKYPVSKGHTLIISKRHFESYFEATEEERGALEAALFAMKGRLDEEYHPQGYNIGVNVGLAAGQTIMHVHIHLIPRYTGDVSDAWGGVRNLIPGKGRYP
jgi:diadenosine tetraphosphate (Ap4A) HIT family hydrolase